MSKLEQDRAALRRLATGVGGAGTSDVVPLIRRGTRLILLLLWAFAVAVVLVSGWVLMRHAESHTEATAISLEQYAQRTFTLADFVVDEFEEFLDERGGIAGVGDDPAGQERLSSLASWLPQGSAVGLALPDGNWAASTLPLPVPPVKANDREWFQAHMRDGAERHVGPAILSRLSKRYIFTYTAPYRAPGGEILGIINIGLPSASITGLSPDDHYTRLALVQHGGAMVAALPFNAEMMEQPFVFPAKPPADHVTVVGSAFGAWSVTAMRHLPANDLYAVVSVPVLGVMQPLMWGVGIGLPLLLLLTQLLRVMSGQLQDKSRQVEQALADNKVLFQEVHHRVKNNLQVVSSLMRLQTERLPSELRPLMEETSARVRAIALVHEQIYRTASPSDVRLDLFLGQLVQQLSASMIGGAAQITTNLQPVTIGLDRAVPVAILATEAITNAIKHGLVDGHGEITVSLASADGSNTIAVRDSGSSTHEEGASGLGTRIMTALTRQIDGEWTLGAIPSGGTLFSLSWPA